MISFSPLKIFYWWVDKKSVIPVEEKTQHLFHLSSFLIFLKIVQSLQLHYWCPFFCFCWLVGVFFCFFHKGQPWLNDERRWVQLCFNFYSPHLISSHSGKKIRRIFCTFWNFQKHIYCIKLLLEISNLAEEQIASLIICCLKRKSCGICSVIYGHKSQLGQIPLQKGHGSTQRTPWHISTILKMLPHIWTHISCEETSQCKKVVGRCFTVW